LLFRISIPVIALGIWFNASADCKTEKECEYIQKHKNQIEAVEDKYKHLENNKAKVDFNKLLPDKETLKETHDKYNSLTENKADVSKYQDLGRNINWQALFDVYGSNWLEMNEKIKNVMEVGENKRKKNLIFYLFSTTVPKQTIVNVFESARKYEDLQLHGVIRGLNRKGKKPVEKYIWNFINDINEKVGGNITVKINPVIFRKAEVNLVPAFVLAECDYRPYGIIRSNECEYMAVIYGDISLEFVVEKFKEAGLWKE